MIHSIRAAAVVAAMSLLAACGTRGPSEEELELQGAVAVLSPDEQVLADPILAGQPLVLPPAFENETWPQTGGEADHAVVHVAAPDRLARQWRTRAVSGPAKKAPLTSPPIIGQDRVYVVDAVASVGSSATIKLSLPSAAHIGFPAGTMFSTFFTTQPLTTPIPMTMAFPQADGVSSPVLVVGPPHWNAIRDSLGVTGRQHPGYVDPGFPALRQVEFPIDPSFINVPNGVIILQSIAVAPQALWISNPICLYIRP